jgi:hypothetical protein
MYSKWKKDHPNGSMSEFVAANKEKLPAGWEERLTAVGDSNLKAGRH